MLRRAVFLAVPFLALSSARLAAWQCPDGSPPPCRGARAANPPARRPAPPLDERTWIVLPFENVARVADIEWLRDASVNLLYLDMSRWRDIRVIDDERVADFIRDAPEARGGTQLTLQGGIAVARLAGAGKLVMGDLLKIGSRTQVVAKVYDVRTGQRLRTVRQEASEPDSIMSAFGRLARAVLNVEPPAGTQLGSVGTSSVGAYQAYLTGVSYLNRWLLDSADAEFTRALALDSSFALAHYKLALVYGWRSPGNRAGAQHASAAQRLGGGLPARERTLVNGYAAFSGQRYAEACDLFGGMVRADSNDVEAWYQLGECQYHDPVVVAAAGDTTRYRFRSSWNASFRAFRRALALDPSYHLAFQHIQDGLLSSMRNGCALGASETVCGAQSAPFQAVVRRAGDSLVTVPISPAAPGGAAQLAADAAAAGAERARRQNLEEARRAAEQWLAAGPTELRPRLAYARILLGLGRVRAADSILQAVGGTGLTVNEDVRTVGDRLEIAFKLGRMAEAVRLADSLRAATAGNRSVRGLGVVATAMFGHPDDLAAFVEQQVQGPPFVKAYFGAQAVAFLGAPSDSLYDIERALVAPVSAGQGAARAAALAMPTLVWTDPRARPSWPVTDTTSGDPRLRLVSVLATGDTVRFRRELARFDSIAGARVDEPDQGYALAGALAHLAVADTAGALAHLRRFRDVTLAHTPALDQLGPGFTFAGMLWPRSMLLLADLAAATGRGEEAAAAYRGFIAAWERGDPSVQPIVSRARAALARLGS